MALLPSKPPVTRDGADPRVVGLTEETDQVFSVLRSETARSILLALYDNPTVTSELAERVGTSLQNTQYHLANLHEAELVEVVDTWYSEKGKEMNVYAPTGEPLTLVIGDTESADTCRQILNAVAGENPIRS